MQIPKPFIIFDIEKECKDTISISIRPQDGSEVSFLPGQYNMIYVFGYGEAAISISGGDNMHFVHTIRMVGSVTKALGRLNIGDIIGIRGPFGNSWPLDTKSEHILFITGGIGIAPLIPAISYLQERSTQFQTITLLNGSRTPEDLILQKKLTLFRKNNIHIKQTVDVAKDGWNENVGVVTKLISSNIHDAKNTLVMCCGPEVMIKFATLELARENVEEKNIFVSLERNMECSIGFCGHCQLGPYILCKDGPIFSYDKVKKFLMIKEI